MNEIVFVTHNRGKIETATRELKGVNFRVYEYDLEEPRSDGIAEISKAKVLEAYKLVGVPCISLDSGFFIESLNGFPRAFVNFALDTIGIDGILKLMEGEKNRKCYFKECLSYFDGSTLNQFFGKTEGTLACEIAGSDSKMKWSDLWYIFIPKNYDKTLAQMSPAERIQRENERKDDSYSSFSVFAKWYLSNVASGKK